MRQFSAHAEWLSLTEVKEAVRKPIVDGDKVIFLKLLKW